MSVLSFPALSSATLSGSRYVSPNGVVYIWDRYSWTGNGNAINPNPIYSNPFLYRTIYTRGYTHCGYQSGSPWRNTNRTLHSTDTTTNLGDMMDYNASYIDGGFSDYYTYVFNDSGGVNGTSNIVSTMNMLTEAVRSLQTSRYLTTSRANCKALMNPGLTNIYITGGYSATTDKFNTLTDTMLAANSVPNSPTSGGTAGGLSGFFGQYYGIVGANGTSGALNWDSETWTSGTWSSSTSYGGTGASDGQPKGLSSKWGVGYNSNGSYAATSTYYKFNDTTTSITLISSFSRPEACGEENCQVGQDWGYTLGSYNGAQTNNSTKTSYLTDTCIALGSNGQPKGHGGMSSGCCGTGSVTLLNGIMGESI